MNNRAAHFYLEELQRMMTEHRGIFSEEFVCANGMAIQALELNTDIDAVPVVRCKDCIHKPKDKQYCWMFKMFVVDDFFCAEGERRKE